MIKYTEIESAIGRNTALTPLTQEQIQQWDMMFRSDDHKLAKSGLHIPSSICSEVQRLVFAESEINASDQQMQKVIDDVLSAMQTKISSAFALGGMAFKPYYGNGNIVVDLVRADRFFPVSFDAAGRIQSAVFVEPYRSGNFYYYRLEYHEYDPQKHTASVSNYTFRSDNENSLGFPCSLEDTPTWANLQPVTIFEHVNAPLFSYFKIPKQNVVNPDSPLGVSVYANAAAQIMQADQIWNSIMWEYQSKENKILASGDFFDPNGKLSGIEKRLFMKTERNAESPFFNIYSPEIRETSYFKCLNEIIQHIESTCGFAVGTLSHAENVEKTATELRISKQRSYTLISSIQKSLQYALQQLADAALLIMQYYDIPCSSAQITCNWGDSVLEDVGENFSREIELVRIGALKPEILLMNYYRCSEEEAKKMMPPEPKESDFSLYGGRI